MTKKRNMFNWSLVWTRLFVVVVVIALSTQIFSFLTFRADVQERRIAFCESENRSNVKQRQFWVRILALPRSPDDPPPGKETIKAFNKLLAETFPEVKCR